jgi:hypothetical protein
MKTYGKQTGGAPVPLTIRIDWLPDGAIVPRLYWTPDGSCCEVTRVFESIPMAYLKDKGEGIRFRVRAKIIETPEPYSQLQHAQFESYLYLADGRFSAKNIIDGRYGHAAKEFIPVTLDVFPDGGYELTHFSVQGTRYRVEKTVGVEPRGAFRAGGVGVRHKVRARKAGEEDGSGRQAALYFEINKWFVSVTQQGG